MKQKAILKMILVGLLTGLLVTPMFANNPAIGSVTDYQCQTESTVEKDGLHEWVNDVIEVHFSEITKEKAWYAGKIFTYTETTENYRGYEYQGEDYNLFLAISVNGPQTIVVINANTESGISFACKE